MKRFFLLCLILAMGCKAKDGSVGLAGPQGNAGDAIPSHQMLFQPGQLPVGSYSGVTIMNLDSQTPDSSFADGSTIRFAQATLPTGRPNRMLMRWDITQYVPSNAVITSALLQLVTLPTSSYSGAGVTIGVFDMSSAVMVDTGSCIWNATTTWNRYDGTIIWSTCGGGSPDIARGFQYPQTPMSTVVIPASASGNQYLWAWNITPSIVQKWINTPAKNNGLIITSVNEFSEVASGQIVFGTAGSSATTRPTLIVDYYIP